ncbi:hypothetical protein BS17DRAFT_774263 [Gyrodon lividus]|nr:hypothetical protein BS17DRAFT_774263 [Gyrodon lividus]
MKCTTALWEIVKNKLQDPGLNIRSDCLDVPEYLLKQVPQPLFLFPILFLLFVFVRSREEDRTRTRTALQALLTIITPTCSLWPTRYIELARRAESFPHPRISLPLEMVIGDAIAGVIEFRDPINDLADLVGSGIKVYGWIICLSIEWKWWIEAFEWWIAAKVCIHVIYLKC